MFRSTTSSAILRIWIRRDPSIALF